MKRSRRRLGPTQVAAYLLVALALAFGVESIRLGLWLDGMPGPGLLSLIASAVLAPLAILSAWRGGSQESGEPFRAQPLAAGALFFACALSYPWVGFVIPSFVLLVAWIRIFHQRSVATAVALSAALVGVCILAFHSLLKVPMSLWPTT